MSRSFWNAAGISVAAGMATILVGFAIDFRATAFAAAALLVWTGFCLARLIQLRVSGAYRSEERDSYGFALGGSISSGLVLLAILVLTQVV
jgi:hypothetical protein